jgi:hypothetical protein
MNYRILHLREAHMRDRGFRSLAAAGPVDLGYYQEVYSGEIADAGNDTAMLESLFHTFNVDHPADYRAHSMSVSDIVMLDNARLWFCDSIGWVALTGENAPVAKSPLVLDVSGKAGR